MTSLGIPGEAHHLEGGVAHDDTPSHPHWTDPSLYLTTIGPQLSVSSLVDFPCGHLKYWKTAFKDINCLQTFIQIKLFL